LSNGEGNTAQNTAENFKHLTETYALFSRAEGHSQKSIDIVILSIKIFARFLEEGNRGICLEDAGPADIRLFIMHRKDTTAFLQHRLTHPQNHPLPGHTINATFDVLQVDVTAIGIKITEIKCGMKYNVPELMFIACN
jgi:hypothetical protein